MEMVDGMWLNMVRGALVAREMDPERISVSLDAASRHRAVARAGVRP